MTKRKSKLTASQENSVLRSCIKDIFWMARRYAHGRHTYAPEVIRIWYNIFKANYPELIPNHDCTLEPPSPNEVGQWELDWLHDCNENERTKL